MCMHVASYVIMAITVTGENGKQGKHQGMSPDSTCTSK